MRIRPEIRDLREEECIAKQILPLHHRRTVGACTLFYRMFYGEASEVLCNLMPDIQVHDPRLRKSVRPHDLAVVIPRSNLVKHQRSFIPSTARVWNSLPEHIPKVVTKESFKMLINKHLSQ